MMIGMGVLAIAFGASSNVLSAPATPRRLPQVMGNTRVDSEIQLTSAIELVQPRLAPTEPDAQSTKLEPITKSDIPEPANWKQTLASQAMSMPQEVFDIDLANALGLGGANHLQVQLARSRVVEAQSAYLNAKASWLPSIRFAVAYNNHTGQLQETEGTVSEVSRSSLFVGGGVGPANGGPLTAGGGGPPRMFVSMSLADVAFDPLVARQLVGAANAQGSVALNDALVDIADAYFNLVEAYGLLANARLAQQVVKDLEEQITAFRASGLGTLAESQRLRLVAATRRRAVADANRLTRTRSAELARLVRLPPQVRLTPADEVVLPVDFLTVQEPIESLIARGIASRPEMQRFGSLQQAACLRVKQERIRPWLPSLHVGYSGGAFGGGEGSDFESAEGRSDLDLIAVWELKNLGVGNVATLRQRRSQLNQIELEMLEVSDRIAAEVTTAAADVESYREQVEMTREALAFATEGYQMSLEQVRQGEGKPIELLAPISELASAHDAYTHAATQHNQSQYQLMRALGTAPTSTASGN